MKLIRNVLLGFAALIFLFLLVGILLPEDFEIERHMNFKADKAHIHSYVGDLKKWQEWTPWKQGEDFIKLEYSEKTTGVGARQSWSGQGGSGYLEITYSNPEKGIGYDLVFAEGSDVCLCTISYEDMPGGTKVTWKMKGEVKALLGGYMALALPSMIGPMFEDGLQALNAKLFERKAPKLEAVAGN